MALSPIELLYGPTLIGIFMNITLYGIMVTQTFLYISTFKDDKLWMKLFVGLLFVVDTANTIFDMTFIYQRLVRNFGNVEAVVVADWVFNTDPALTAVIALMVQLFFAWRVKLLTSNKFLTAAIIVCSVVQCLSGIATAIACSIVTHFVEFHKFQAVVILWLSFSALTDVIIAIALVNHLQHHRTGFAVTDDIINKLTRLTVQTGAITAVFAVIDLIAFVASTSGLHLAFNMPLAKLYTNSLLSTLNARAIGQQQSKFANVHSGDLGMGAARVRNTNMVHMDSGKIAGTPVMMNQNHNDSVELGHIRSDTKIYVAVEEHRNIS